MATTSAPVMSDRDLFNYAYLQGKTWQRKFLPDDLTRDGKLAQAARLYAQAYTGAFEYMVQMRDAIAMYGQLTPGQGKGVLNCLMADANRRLSHKAPATPVAANATPRFAGIGKVIPGRYRVEMPDATIAVWIEPAHDPRKGLSVKTAVADAWYWWGNVGTDGTPFIKHNAPRALAPALDVLRNADDSLVYGLSYAMHGSACFICGRALDTAESISAGYGPVCAKKHDLPWGAKAVPAAVKLARAGLGGVAPLPVTPDSVTRSTPGGHTYEEIFGEDAA